MKKKGFTLIELLVVVAIIGVLATVVLGALGSARVRAQDAKRITIVKQLETALEMYYLDHGDYPNMYVHTYNAGANKTAFATELAPYIKIDVDDNIFGPYWVATDTRFNYRSKSGDNYQTYGMSIRLLDQSNDFLEQNDGGYVSYEYEVGQQPKYFVHLNLFLVDYCVCLLL